MGDEITVNVNDSTQSKFLVIEDKNDTVKAIYKLDGLPDYIKQTLAATKQTLSAKLEGNSKSLKNLSASTKDIKDLLAKYDAKLEDVMKMNKVLLWMVVISMLLTVILNFI